MKRDLLHIIGVVCCIQTMAQPVDQLPPVKLNDAVVLGVSYDPHPAVIHEMDSLLQAALPSSSIGELLEMGSTLSLRHRGPTGNLISGSALGLMSDHLMVTWMGVPINSPSLGMTDLSALPAALFTHPVIHGGSAMTRSQGGAAAGMIHLNGGDVEERYLHFGSSFDELENLMSWFRTGYRINQKITAKTSFQIDRARNKFKYTDPFIRHVDEREQENNDFGREALIQELKYRGDQGFGASFGLWLQRSELEIPDIMGKYGRNIAQQRDSSLRLNASVFRHTSFGKFSLKYARFAEGMHYTMRLHEDAEALIDSRISTLRHFLQGGWESDFGKYHAEVYVDYSAESVGSENHGDGGAQRTLRGLQARLERRGEVLRLNAGFRMDSGNGANVPVPELSITYFQSRHELALSAGKIFRYPDLNELYWQPGGNPNLLPEQGLRSDLSYRLRTDKKKFELQAVAMFRSMDMMIVWLPSASGLQAENIQETEAVGLQVSIKGNVAKEKLRIQPMLDLHWQETYKLAEALQPFFPRVRLRCGLNVHSKKWFAGSALRYTAESWLPEQLNTTHFEQDAVLMADVFAGTNIAFGAQHLRLSVMARNIGDVMDFRTSPVATPGRFFSLKVEYLINRTDS